MRERLNLLIKKQEIAIQGDGPDAKRLGRLLRILKFVAPSYIRALAVYGGRLLTTGYIAGMADALGEQVKSEDLGHWVEKAQGDVKELVKPRNPWADPLSYAGAHYSRRNGFYWK